MPEYRRIWSPGGTFFFTLVTNQRRKIFLEESARQTLREAFRYGMEKAGPFRIDALCLLPDHLHCIWTLPEGASDYATRWKIIKARFSRRYLQTGGTAGAITTSKAQKGEVGVWQRRYWEHMIRDQYDLSQHIDYIHYNPVKHGLVREVKEWPWSTFHCFVREGYYDSDWNYVDPKFESLIGYE